MKSFYSPNRFSDVEDATCNDSNHNTIVNPFGLQRFQPTFTHVDTDESGCNQNKCEILVRGNLIKPKEQIYRNSRKVNAQSKDTCSRSIGHLIRQPTGKEHGAKRTLVA